MKHAVLFFTMIIVQGISASEEVYGEEIANEFISFTAYISLINAILVEDIETVKSLLAKTGDISSFFDQFGNPLHYAVTIKNREICSLLIQYGCDVNYIRPVDGYAPLHIAAYMGNSDIAKLFIQSGANVFAKTSKGLTASELAQQQGFVELSKLLSPALVAALARIRASKQ